MYKSDLCAFPEQKAIKRVLLTLNMERDPEEPSKSSTD